MDQDTRSLEPRPGPQNGTPAGTGTLPPPNVGPAPTPYATPVPPPPAPYGDWRAERHAERRAARGGGWMAGAVLIILGVFFLLENTDTIGVHNWWALFILIPAVAAFESAWAAYTRQGAWTAAAMGPLVGGSILTLVALSFLLDWSTGLLFPLALIVGGAALLFGTFRTGMQPPA